MNVELFQLLRGYLRQVGWLMAPVGAGLLAYLVCVAIRVDYPLLWYIVGGVFFGVLLVCLLVFGFKWIRKRRKGASLEDALGQGPDGSVAQQGEINALRKQWKESLGTLKGSGVGGGGANALAALPWFVIIGEPASGKSTLLRQSGIDFPVGDAAIRGLQGTRNCDWWFSNIGVFLDTAGRYVSDASAGEWASFLELVRKHRTGSPINGVIVAVPAPDLLSKNVDQLDYQARQIRARLDELIDHLGVNFPVWVTLTKVDLVAGFAEFFGQADAQTRRQMMGWTLDQAQGMRFERAVFDRYYQATVHRLREIRPVLIEKAKLRDRPAAYAFPDELGSMADALGSMLSKMFEPNVYQDTPFFRGLYVTSATQQGTPLQRAAQHIREMLGAPGAPPDPHQAIIKHAYFVKDLMNERVVSDREMTWTTKREIERNKTRRFGQNLTGASFGVLLAFIVLAFGVNAKNELDIVQEQYETSPRGTGGAERSDALWIAAANASDDPLRNFGLSQQRVLKRKLEERQVAVYDEQVLEALMRGFEEDANSVSTEQGLEELISRWDEYRYVRAGLERALVPLSEPPAPEFPDLDEDGNPIEYLPWDPDDIEAPPGFFAPEERAAFIARGDRFQTSGVVGSLDAADFPRLLLLAIWRNGTEPIADRLEGIRDVYMKKLYEYLGRAASEVVDIGAWRDGFREACQKSLLVLDTPRVEQDELRKALELMFMRASGPPSGTETGPAPPGGRLDPIWRSTLADDLQLLQIKELLRLADLQEEAKFEALMPWFDGTASSVGGAQADLTTLAQMLGALRKETDQARGLATGPWGERGTSISAVLDHIDAEVEAKGGTWAEKAVPHLAPLANLDPTAYSEDEARWGRAVELIEPGMRRNALLKAFLEIDHPGAFPSLATEVVESRTRKAAEDPEAFDRKAMSDALRELAKVTSRTGKSTYSPQVAGSIQMRAETEVEQRFGRLVDAARAHWDEKCAALPSYGGGGEGEAYLKEWVTPEGAIVVLSKRLQTLYGKSWPISDELRDDAAAAAAWDKTAALRTRYSFFMQNGPLGKVKTELERQLGLRKIRLVAGSAPAELKRLDKELPGGGGPKEFSASTWLADDTNRLISDGVRRGLDGASRDVQFRVLQDVSEYYNTAWGYKVDDVRAVLESDSKVEKNRAERELKNFVKELAILFGARLSHNRGGLTVVPGVQNGVTQVERLLGATKLEASVRLTFDCELVPTVTGSDIVRPFVVLEYRSKSGGALRSEPWQPRVPQPWNDIVWREGEDDVFTIYMVKENGSAPLRFRSWSAPNPLRRAIEAGGGGQSLTWSGEGDFSESEAKFTMSVSDRRMFQILMGGASSDGGGGALNLPQNCVRLSR